MNLQKGSRQEIEDPRLTLFKERLTRLRLYDEGYHIAAAFTVEDGYQAMKQFLQDALPLPTALFASSDAFSHRSTAGTAGKKRFVCQKISP